MRLAAETIVVMLSRSSDIILSSTNGSVFAFNGQLANYQQLRQELMDDGDHHLARETDTEIIMHQISRELSRLDRPALIDVWRTVSERFDGAYCVVMLNALGDMLIARDPLGSSRCAMPKKAVCCRSERERRAVEPGLQSRQH